MNALLTGTSDAQQAIRRVFSIMHRFALILILAAAFMTGAPVWAQSLSTTGQGTVVGGLIGAGSGAIVGAAVHHPVVGTLVGGGVGAVGGALVGNQLETEQKTNARLRSELSYQQREIEYQRAEIRQLQHQGEESDTE